MTIFESFGLLLAIAAAFAYVNQRWLKLPTTMGLMALALVAATLLLLFDRLGLWPLKSTASHILDRFAFGDTLLHGMLGVMLFAGALHVDLNDLRRERVAITVLSVGSTAISTAAISGLAYVGLPRVGSPLPFGYCLLFGAIIAPTDPIGVLGVLRQARVPKSLETQIAGESLFNDGVGVVLFLGVLGVLSRGGPTGGIAPPLYHPPPACARRSASRLRSEANVSKLAVKSGIFFSAEPRKKPEYVSDIASTVPPSFSVSVKCRTPRNMPLPSSQVIAFGASKALTVRLKVLSGATLETSSTFLPSATWPSKRVSVEFQRVKAGASVSTAHTVSGLAAMKVATP